MKKCIKRLIMILLVTAGIAQEGIALADRSVGLQEGISTLARQLLSRRSPVGQKKIAIADFTSLYGETGNLGGYIREELTVMLQNQGTTLLERSLLFQALQELELNMTDLVDPQYSKRFGRFTGTEILLLGVITEFQETVKINVRLVDIETLHVVSVGDVLISKDKHVQKIMGIPYPGNIIINTVRGASVYLDDALMGQTGIWGKLEIDKVTPGSHIITVQREGYRTAKETIYVQEDQEVRMEISMTKLPSPAVAVTLSLLFPGAGDIYLGHNDWWLYTLGVGGSIYGAVYYSKRTEDLVWVTNDSGSGQHLDKRGEAPMYLFAALAAGIWIYDLIHVSSSAKASRYVTGSPLNDNGFIALMPDAGRPMIGYRWTW